MTAVDHEYEAEKAEYRRDTTEPKASRLKLEVGKTYRNREGDKVRIVDRRYHTTCPFKGDDNCHYQEDGGFHYHENNHGFDLVEECEPDAPAAPAQTDKAEARKPIGSWDVNELAVVQAMAGVFGMKYSGKIPLDILREAGAAVIAALSTRPASEHEVERIAQVLVKADAEFQANPAINSRSHYLAKAVLSALPPARAESSKEDANYWKTRYLLLEHRQKVAESGLVKELESTKRIIVEWERDMKGTLAALDRERAENARLTKLLNTPEIIDFGMAVQLEAAHQRERWDSEHDAGKTPADWFWLVGCLAGKALHAQTGGNIKKALHHVITTAAALCNWHASIMGKTDMRPGIEPPPEFDEAKAPTPAPEENDGKPPEIFAHLYGPDGKPL